MNPFACAQNFSFCSTVVADSCVKRTASFCCTNSTAPSKNLHCPNEADAPSHKTRWTTLLPLDSSLARCLHHSKSSVNSGVRAPASRSAAMPSSETAERWSRRNSAMLHPWSRSASSADGSSFLASDASCSLPAAALVGSLLVAAKRASGFFSSSLPSQTKTRLEGARAAGTADTISHWWAGSAGTLP